MVAGCEHADTRRLREERVREARPQLRVSEESAVTGVPRKLGTGYAVRVCARFLGRERRRERAPRALYWLRAALMTSTHRWVGGRIAIEACSLGASMPSRGA